MATAIAQRVNTPLAPVPKVVPLRGGEHVTRELPESFSGEQHDFPIAASIPPLPAMPDETLDFYGFVFCQGGFCNLGMSFEHFLMVVAATCGACDGWGSDGPVWTARKVASDSEEW